MWMRSYRAIARACAAEDVIARSARVWVLDRKVLTYVGITLRRPEQTIGRSPAALARRLGAALVDQDTATAPLVAVVADLVGVEDLDDQRLAGPTRRARYETVTALAEDNLRVGIPVVLVAPFTDERRDPDAWAALDRRLRAAGGTPLLVWLQLRPTTAIQRLRARGAARDLAVADPAAFIAGLDLAAPAGPHVTVDGESPTDDILRRVLAALVEHRA
jgi:predicted kinase